MIIMVEINGFEPITSRLQGGRSPVELYPQKYVKPEEGSGQDQHIGSCFLGEGGLLEATYRHTIPSY